MTGGYDLQSEELILLDTILTSGYFDDLVEKYQNKYITNNIMEFIQPLQSQTYDLEFTEDKLKERIKRKQESPSCINQYYL